MGPKAIREIFAPTANMDEIIEQHNTTDIFDEEQVMANANPEVEDDIDTNGGDSRSKRGDTCVGTLGPNEPSPASGNARPRRRKKQKAKKREAIERAAKVTETAKEGLQYSVDHYTIADLPELKKMGLDFWLTSKAVGLKSIDELEWGPGQLMLVCPMSPAGTMDSTIIGARIVSYYEPFEAAVLNLTVINEDNRGAKNLDPLNKTTTDKLIKLFPDMQRVMLATSAEFSPANFKNYTTTGLPFKQPEDKEYTFVKMVTDADWGDSFPFGTEEEWIEYDRIYSYDELDTLIATVPFKVGKRAETDTEDESIQQPATKKAKTSDLVPEERQKELNAQGGQNHPDIVDAVPA